VLLANGLALSAQQAWDSPHSQRWQYLTSLYLQISMEEVQQQLHQQAANSARQHAMPDLWHPAVSLIWPWGTIASGRDAASGRATAEDLAQWRAMRRTAGRAEPLHQCHAPDHRRARSPGRQRHASRDDS
jgi:hypothetical protein